MSKICEVCGKKPIFGNNISHAHNKTKRRWNPNIQRVRVRTPDGKVRRIKILVYTPSLPVCRGAR